LRTSLIEDESACFAITVIDIGQGGKPEKSAAYRSFTPFFESISACAFSSFVSSSLSVSQERLDRLDFSEVEQPNYQIYYL
jgi:hypothetical protein